MSGLRCAVCGGALQPGYRQTLIGPTHKGCASRALGIAAMQALKREQTRVRARCVICGNDAGVGAVLMAPGWMHPACVPPGTAAAPPETIARAKSHVGVVIALVVLGALAFGGCAVCVCVAASDRHEQVAARPAAATPAPAPPRAPTPTPVAGPHCCDGTPANCVGRGCCSKHGGVCN